MQNLYMMAALLREKQLQQMATEVNAGLIIAEQAMEKFNVANFQTVVERVKLLKEQSGNQSTKNQSETAEVNVLAA